MSRGYVLIDGNSIGYAANSSKKLDVGGMQVQAIYGFVRALRKIVSTFPNLTPIVLWDGKSWRKEVFEGYKAKRDATDTATQRKQTEMREIFRAQKPFIHSFCAALGVHQFSADNLEADDLAGMLVRRYDGTDRRIVLITADKDWIQLVGPKVMWFDPINDQRITAGTLQEKLGVATPQAWLEVKALMGDTSDEIPGVGGIGEKGALELLATYGGVTKFVRAYRAGELSKVPKKFVALATDPEKIRTFARNMKLMDLRNPSMCPMPKNLRVVHLPLDKTAFGALCDDLMFRSISRDLDAWCEPFEQMALAA